MTPEELDRAGTGDLGCRVADAGIVWRHYPITDYAAPDPAFEASWPAWRIEVLEALDRGDRVLVHCRAGRGRSGTVAAALLIAGGLGPDEAIAAVREVRPGAIETPGQEAWLRRLAP